jgi:hypothetical protein
MRNSVRTRRRDATSSNTFSGLEPIERPWQSHLGSGKSGILVHYLHVIGIIHGQVVCLVQCARLYHAEGRRIHGFQNDTCISIDTLRVSLAIPLNLLTSPLCATVGFKGHSFGRVDPRSIVSYRHHIAILHC